MRARRSIKMRVSRGVSSRAVEYFGERTNDRGDSRRNSSAQARSKPKDQERNREIKRTRRRPLVLRADHEAFHESFSELPLTFVHNIEITRLINRPARHNCLSSGLNHTHEYPHAHPVGARTYIYIFLFCLAMFAPHC